MSSADQYCLHLRDEFQHRFEHEIPNLVANAFAPFYEMLEKLSQTLGPNSAVDSDSVANSDSNSLVVSDMVCSEVTPDNAINHYCHLSQPFPASGIISHSLFTLSPPYTFHPLHTLPAKLWHDDDVIGSLQCLLSKLFPPYFNVPTCDYGKAVALLDTVPFDPGPLIHPLHCSSVFPNNMIGCVVASSFKLPCDDGFSDHDSSKYFRAGFFSVDQHMFVEIPHPTFIDFVKTLHNFTEAMVLILAATVNRDLTVIVNGSYISDTFVEVFYNFNTQLQIVELQDHGRVFTIVSVDDKSISYFNFRTSILANKFLEGGKGGTFRFVEEVQDIDEFFKLTPLQDGLDAIGDSWFHCQKLTFLIGGVWSIF
ncbi:ATP synthase gamma chain chloroplastic-like [Trifolium pratense]|uniref:Uncharacterized protein n=2 Tax=Trifolium pratense TaxID=57577 RepID=A0ACB0KXQ7_TRIPR|nr:ATP synthase gamma chain chloroplastic-like [Trifolium pratense]CAJ2661430.1 unnamed protein product [Trifolium pratense]